MQMVQFSFFQTKKHTFLLNVNLKKKHIFFLYVFIYIVYISVNFFLHFSRAGTVHTLGTEACHTCIAFCILQLVGWQAQCHPGSAAVGESILCLHQHIFSLTFCLLHRIHTHTAILYIRHASCLDDIRVGEGGLRLVQQASSGIIKALQQGSGAHADMGREWVGTGTEKVISRWKVCRVQMEGVGSSPGLQTDS